MSKKKFKFSSLHAATAGFIALFLAINVSQSGCSGCDSNGGNGGKDSTATGGTGQKSVLSGIVPGEVNIPNPSSDNVKNRPAFDSFSWQMFIALCWPVVNGQRGVPLNPNDPNTFLNMTNTTPVVWTSYKNQWDLFGQGTNTPSPWNSWTDPVNPGNSKTTLSHVLGATLNSMPPADVNQSFSVPLIDQNRNYALYEIRYNEVQYNFIVNNNLYLKSDLTKYLMKQPGNNLTMPASTATQQGSILVKAAWRILTAKDDPSRYYVINDSVYDPVTQKSVKVMMGLVGLHIAQKVDSFPQWVWSSFEQVDNVPDSLHPTGHSCSFNNGTASPSTGNHGYANKPASKTVYPDSAQRPPVQVNRLNPIPTTPAGFSTVDINKSFQAAVGNTWMKYYELVITQWPSNPGNFLPFTLGGIYPDSCGAAFPVNDCVNTTMETYYQNRNDAIGAGGNSCMSCHYKAPNTDFSWSLQLRSH